MRLHIYKFEDDLIKEKMLDQFIIALTRVYYSLEWEKENQMKYV